MDVRVILKTIRCLNLKAVFSFHLITTPRKKATPLLSVEVQMRIICLIATKGKNQKREWTYYIKQPE